MGWNLFKKSPRPLGGSSNQLSMQAQMMDTMHKLAKSGQLDYWKDFKIRKPTEAKAIERLLNRDMSKLSDSDAFEIVTTLLRWSENAKVSIDQLKNWTVNNMGRYIKDAESLNEAISMLKSEKMKEAQDRHISPDNTSCNFMLEFLLEHEQEMKSDAICASLVDKLGVSESEKQNLVDELKQKMKEQNIAPDISKLDREENKLFSLAKRASEMFDGFSYGIDTEPIRLTIEGKIEARILCSTMVMELHSNFKNEIDMDVQADRYFLLLADSIICDSPKKFKNTIDFINNRIAFYKEQCAACKNMNSLDVFISQNPLSKIYNALYNYPLSDQLEDNANFTVTPHELVMFKPLFEKVQKYIRIEKDRIIGKSTSIEENIRSRALEIFEGMVPQARRNEINQDVAWLFSDQIIETLKSGHIDNKLKQILPYELVSKIQDLISICKNNNISSTHLADILETTQQDYISQYKL